MAYKTIKISEENYRWLLNIAAELQRNKGEKISFNDALEDLKNSKKIRLSDLAGTWKLSDKEAKELTEKIYKERKTQSKI